MRALIFLTLSLLTACSADMSSTSTSAEPVVAPAKGWTYYASKDKMTDRIYRQAQIESIDKLPGYGPYPAAPLTLSISDNGSVFVSVPQQFECYSDSCSITARFDGGHAMRIEASELNLDPPSLSLEDSYENNPFGYARLADFLALIKTSKQVMIEVPIFRQGGQVATFDLSGFDEKRLKALKPTP